MNEKEALKIISNIPVSQINPNTGKPQDTDKIGEAFSVLANALEELESYRKLGSVEELSGSKDGKIDAEDVERELNEMSIQDAINSLKYRIETASKIVGKGEDGNAFWDMEMAIEALENKKTREESRNAIIDGFVTKIHNEFYNYRIDGKSVDHWLDRLVDSVAEEMKNVN